MVTHIIPIAGFDPKTLIVNTINAEILVRIIILEHVENMYKNVEKNFSGFISHKLFNRRSN